MALCFRFLCFLGLMGMGLSSAYASDTASPSEMTFCYENQNYLPFIKHSPEQGVVEGKVVEGKNGALPDLVIKATQKLGIRAVFVRKPWKRCIVLLRAGEVDGIFAAIWQPDRDKWGVFPKAANHPDIRYRIWQVNYSIYSHRNSGLTWDGSTFSGVLNGISAPLGYVAEGKLRQLGVKSRSSYLPSEGLRLVAKNRLDAYVLESTIGDYLVSSEGLGTLVRSLPAPLFSADWYLPLSHQLVKKYPDISVRFWKALADARQTHGETLKKQYQLN